MSYLLTQMFLYMLCTFLLGLLLGWLFWRNSGNNTAELDALMAERTALRKDRDDLRTSLDACRVRTQQAVDEIQTLTATNRDLQNRQTVALLTATTPTMAVAKPRPVAAPLAAIPAAKPKGITGPRGGKADALQDIIGVGPKLEQLLFSLGYYHFDQIAAWTPSEIAWVDDNLEGFKGRVTRDDWVAQAREFARR